VSQATDSPAAVFGAEAAERALAVVCELAGLDRAGASLMRLGENALYHLPGPSVVVRIARSADYGADAAKEVDVARWLAAGGFPAARLWDEAAQPVLADGHPVTFWQYIEGRNGGRGDIAHLAALLRDLHALPRPAAFSLPPDDILGRVGRRISRAAVPARDKDFLSARLTDLQERLLGLRFPLAPGPVHGDAHVQNLMIRVGQPVLIDFERAGWGQPEWDLAMTATEYQTAGWWSAPEYALFCKTYGFDVTTWAEGWPVLQAVHAIKMTTWLMQNVAASADIAAEYAKRMRTLRGEGSQPETWRPF